MVDAVGSLGLLFGSTEFASTSHSHCAFTPSEVDIGSLQIDGDAEVGESGGGRRAEYSSEYITCLACSASCVYVGTSTGHILVITFPDAGGRAITHARAETGMGGHAVKQLGGSPTADQLGHILALAGSSLRMHDASSLEQKGASILSDCARCFACGTHAQRWVLAVGEDDAIVIFEHRGMGYAQTRRVPMWRPPEEIAMMQESAAFYVLAGKTCALVSGPLDEGEAKVSVVCDAAFRQGCLAQMSAREVLVAAFDGHAMMLSSTGEARNRPPIGHMLPPRRATATCPYIVVQSPDGFVGVYLQRAPYPLVQMFSPTRLGEGGGGGLATDGVRVMMSTGNKIVCLLPVPIDKQVSEVLSRKSEGGEVRAKEALSLFDDLHQESRTDPATALHLRASACQEAVFALFHNAQFDQSVEIALGGCATLDPRELLSYSSGATLPGYQPRHSSRWRSPLAGGTRDILETICRVKTNEAGGGGVMYEELLQEGKKALCRLAEAHRENLVFAQTEQAGGGVGGTSGCISLVEVDTALVRLYADLRSPKLSVFLSKPSSALVGHCEDLLRERGLYNALAKLYGSAGRTRDALLVYRSLGEGGAREAGRTGVEETVEVLRSCGKWELTAEYSKWVLARGGLEGLHIFTSGGCGGDRARIAAHLETHNPRVYRAYLEDSVLAKGEPELCFRLASLYAAAVLSGLEGGAGRAILVRILKYASRSKDIAKGGQELLELVEGRGMWEEEVLLLGMMGHCEREQLETDRATKGRGAGVTKHRRALQILVWVLCNIEAAEAFCRRSWRHVGAQGIDVDMFLLLVDVLVSPPPSELPASAEAKAGSKEAVSLIARHSEELSPDCLVSSLPGNVSLSEVSELLAAAVRSSAESFSRCRIEKGLARVENVQVHALLAGLERRSVTIHRDTACPVTRKRVGDRAFVLYPNGSVVLLQAAGDLTRDPVSGMSFREGRGQGQEGEAGEEGGGPGPDRDE